MELRQLRAAAGKSREEVAEETDINRATLYRIEKAQTKPQVRTLRALLEFYKVPAPRCAELLTILKSVNQQGWLQTTADLPSKYATYIQFEAEASAVINYEACFVPGLLQTEEYARAAITGSGPEIPPEEIEGRVAVRMERQTQHNPMAPIHAVIDEAVLHRQIGGPRVMKEQLQRLLRINSEPGRTLQVIPYGAGAHAGMHGAFVILKFTEEDPDVIYVEGHGTDLFLESEADLKRYNRIFDHLKSVAAAPGETEAIVARVLAEQ